MQYLQTMKAEEIKIDDPANQIEKSDTRWKNKFIRIWKLNE